MLALEVLIGIIVVVVLWGYLSSGAGRGSARSRMATSRNGGTGSPAEPYAERYESGDYWPLSETDVAEMFAPFHSLASEAERLAKEASRIADEADSNEAPPARVNEVKASLRADLASVAQHRKELDDVSGPLSFRDDRSYERWGRTDDRLFDAETEIRGAISAIEIWEAEVASRLNPGQAREKRRKQ